MGYYPRRPMVRAIQPPKAQEPTPTPIPTPTPLPTPVIESGSVNRFRASTAGEWNDYVWRNRNFLIARYYSHPDVPVAISWVMQNIDEIAARVGEYYGDSAAEQIRINMRALHDSMINATDYVRNAPSNFEPGSDRQLGDLLLRWKDRSEALASAFATLNPRVWNTLEMRNAINNFQDFWWNQILPRRYAEWVKDLNNLDYAFDNAVILSDLIAKGITEEYPTRFS